MPCVKLRHQACSVADNHNASPPSYYFTARLSAGMQSLAEAPRRISWAGVDGQGDDKPTLHKLGPVYYLTSGALFSTSSSVYGPWTFRGSSGDGRYGLQAQAHGNFFTWRGQWFHIWCTFVDPRYRWRQSWMTYTHYATNGSLVDDEDFLDAHGATGVGRYSAAWPAIQAEWYMATKGTSKVEQTCAATRPCFAVAFLSAGGYIAFPAVADAPATGALTLGVSTASGASTIDLRSGSEVGPVLASCAVPASEVPANVSCALIDGISGSPRSCQLDLFLVANAPGLMLDWFSIHAS